MDCMIVPQAREAMMNCRIEGCTNAATRKSLCTMHYMRVRRHGDPEIVQKHRIHDPQCAVEGCEKPYFSNGLCSSHYRRWLRRRNAGVSTLDLISKIAPPPPHQCQPCQVPGCERERRSHGYCMAHWRRVKAGRDPNTPLRPRASKWAGKVCDTPGCERDVYAHGECSRCYFSVYRRKLRQPIVIEPPE
jgi:hypothetical protein